MNTRRGRGWVGLMVAMLVGGSGGAQAQLTVLHTFTGGAGDGAQPWGSLTAAGSMLYGTTPQAGSKGFGTIFQVDTSGNNYATLYSFTNGNDGAVPYGPMALGGSALYGTTYTGGASNYGTLFQISTNGSGFSVVHTFGGNTDGGNPYPAPTLVGATLYGVTSAGGTNNAGIVFKVNTNGSAYSLLYTFTNGSDGSNPYSTLAFNGTTFYGMTSRGGTNFNGTVFSISTGGVFTLLHTFAGGATDGSQPFGSLTFAGSTLYGMTQNGGISNKGTVFQINPDGSGFSLLHSLTGGNEGSFPLGSLTLAGSTLYGMTKFGGVSNAGTVFQVNTNGSSFTTLYTFSGGSDGSYPYGSLTLAGAALCGMTQSGGSNNNGTVFAFMLPVTVTGAANPTNSGSVTGGGAYTAGSNAVLTAMASNGWRFVRWNDSATNNPYTITVPPTNITYTATFLPTTTVTVQVNTNLGGSASGGGTFFVGSNAVLTATASNGWRFIRWNDGATNNPYTITVAPTNSTYTADFLPTALITVGVNTNVGGSVAGGGDFLVGSNQILTATASNGWQFVGWSDGFTTNPYTITVPATNTTYTANFVPAPAQLFFQNGAGQVVSWLLATNGHFQTSRLLGSAGGWQLMTAGDVDGDGVSDLLFQTHSGDTAGWLLDSSGAIRGVINWGNVGAWKLRACADYAGAGHVQIFFQHPQGQVALWHIGSNGVFQSAELVLTNASPWQLRAATPHTAGGRADLYWQNAAGLVAVWQQLPAGGWLAQVVGNTGAWVLCGAVDVEGDGAGDLFWQAADGNTAGWFMNSNNTMRAVMSLGQTSGWTLKAAGR